jgi:hypothetical protein
MHGNGDDLYQTTMEARSKLYDLITYFRKTASSTNDPKARAIFTFAAEVVAGLARAFRAFQKQLEVDNLDE